MVSYPSAEQGNKQEIECGTQDYEEHHATGSCRFNHRYHGQCPDDSWIRPNGNRKFLGFQVAHPRYHVYALGFVYSPVDYSPPSPG
jgi:hypothetical protein